ncbi:hypothetical protein SCAR479_04784 [Seiridium cardinale]|uniref:Uncharacterized protein n=1 Tax=Seiridium cardinale TaxID=138064 RepID=A0ABR2XX72_9PEZI
MNRLDFNKYCVCSACRGKGGTCESLKAYDEHVKTVGSLILHDSQSVALRISEWSTGVSTELSCPLILIAYFSRVIDREVQKQLAQKKTIAILKFRDKKLFGDDFKKMITWCYTGQIQSHSPVDIYNGNILERLWNLAADLEMPEFANYCMRGLMSKYTHDVSLGGLLGDFLGNAAPYQYYGLLHVQRQNSTGLYRSEGSHRGRLFCFMQRLLENHPPISSDVMAQVKERVIYEHSWYKAMIDDHAFCLWIKDLATRSPEHVEDWWVNLWNDFMVRTDDSDAVTWIPLCWDKPDRLLNDLAPTTVIRRLREWPDCRAGDIRPFDCEVPGLLRDMEHIARGYDELRERASDPVNRVVEWEKWRKRQQRNDKVWEEKVRTGQKRSYDEALGESDENDSDSSEVTVLKHGGDASDSLLLDSEDEVLVNSVASGSRHSPIDLSPSPYFQFDQHTSPSAHDTADSDDALFTSDSWDSVSIKSE